VPKFNFTLATQTVALRRTADESSTGARLFIFESHKDHTKDASKQNTVLLDRSEHRVQFAIFASGLGILSLPWLG
jgi:hypothetical protein